MLSVSECYKRTITDVSRTWRINLEVTLSTGEIIHLNETDIVLNSLTYQEGATCTDTLQIGSTFSNSLNFTLQNDQGKFNQYNFSDAKISCTIGLLINEDLDIYEDVPLGNFNVLSAGKKSASIPIKCMDDMYKANVAPQTVGFFYPTTMVNFVLMLTSVSGIKLSNTLREELRSTNIEINAFNSGDYTCRDLLGYVGVLLGKNLRINREGELESFWYVNNGQRTTMDTRVNEADYSEDTVHFTGISLPDINEVIHEAGSQDRPLEFEINPLISTETLGQRTAKLLHNRIKDIYYKPCTVYYMGDPSWQAGDIITHILSDNTEVVAPLMVRTFKFRGVDTFKTLGTVKEQDNQKTSTEKEFKNYLTTPQIQSLIKQEVDKITLGVTQTLKGYSTTEEVKSLITITAGEITSEVSETLKSYATTIEVNSKITQTSTSIMTEVNKKVNDSDFGTKITQSYTSVQIAWNNISKYVEFADGSINIYENINQTSNTLLTKISHTGTWYYKNGTPIGKIGTNNWANDTNYKGLVFDLEPISGYMCWAHRESSSDANYTVKLIYHTNDIKAKKGLHLACPTYSNGYFYINQHVQLSDFTDGEGGILSTSKAVSLRGPQTSFVCKDNYTFGMSKDKLIDCYNNIDMHNYSILNQSDARYKKNIKPTNIDALTVLSKIELKEFDWIESGEYVPVGFVAQQMREVLPEIVNENIETGRLSIKTDRLIPYIIKAIQELSGVTLSKSKLSTMGINTLSTVSTGWQDTYTLEEKNQFIEDNSSGIYDKTLNEAAPILIPINQTEAVKNEQ